MVTEPPLGMGFKFWLKFGSNPILGPGDIKLLEALQQHKNLTKAAEECGYSYKYAWGKLQAVTKKTRKAVVDAQKGGKGGGGSVVLSAWGMYLLQVYQFINNQTIEFVEKLNSQIEQYSSESLSLK